MEYLQHDIFPKFFCQICAVLMLYMGGLAALNTKRFINQAL